MTAPLSLSAIRARAANQPAYSWPHEAQEDRAHLLAIVERVEALAKAWESRGEHDMAYSKTIPDEYIADAILTDGAQKVENARHLRAALTEEGE